MKLQQAKFHFVGIGGIGMCGLAELLHNMGATVSGSDLSENANTARLKDLGIKVFKGHLAGQLGDADVLVYSSAIQLGNPEIQEARGRKIPMIPRAEALAEIMRLKRGVAIAGTHGKTTTTSMTSAVFIEARLSPTIVVGGRFEMIKSTALLGAGDWLIAEADESDGSFQKLSPEIAIITNIDADHLDHYKTFDNLQKAFLDFAHKVPFYGEVIAWGDDPIVRESLQNLTKKIHYYGFGADNDFMISGERGSFSLFRNDFIKNEQKKLGDFKVKVAGRHNALNATAAICAGLVAGISFDVAARGISHFEGVDRRFHFKGEERGITVYDDYGHHPTEVKAALQGFREQFPDRRLVVYFQPHRYSRTESCWHEFTQSFTLADRVYLGDIYAAGEAPIPGITSEKLALDTQHKAISHLPKEMTQAKYLVPDLVPGDVFITLGAGDGWKLGLAVLEQLKQS